MIYHGMITQFQNKFGAVTFLPISDVAHISTIHGVNLYPSCMFDIETAKKIALITDNRRIQLCPFKTAQGWTRRLAQCWRESFPLAFLAFRLALDAIGDSRSLFRLCAARNFAADILRSRLVGLRFD